MSVLLVFFHSVNLDRLAQIVDKSKPSEETVSHEGTDFFRPDQRDVIQAVRISGDLDGPRSGDQYEVHSYTDKLVINFDGLSHCTSEGVAWLRKYIDLAHKQGAQAIIVCDDERLVKLFHLLGIDKMSELVRGRELALS